LDYRLRIPHATEEEARVWSRVYTSGAGLLYSRGRLIAARQVIGGRDGETVVMIRSARGLDAVQRRHVQQVRATVREWRAVPYPVRVHTLTVGDDVLTDHEQGPRWACEIIRMDGTREPTTVHAFNRDGAWDALRTVCVERMGDDGEPRAPQSVAFRPTSASVEALRPFV
jgi:hypothetical protein